MAHEQRNDCEVITSDGRCLVVDESGAPDGTPVILLHGTPGSRSGPKPRTSVLYRLGVRLISYDRPGYGGSSRSPGRQVADAAADVEAIVDQLKVDRFSVVGRSGGGPHALACAALMPDRVSRTAVLVSLAPSDAVGLDWFAGMTAANVRDYSTAQTDSSAFIEELRQRAERTLDDPEGLIELLLEQMTASDKRFVSLVTIRRILAKVFVEALKNGPYGWIDDVLALRDDWGFRLDGIETPVMLWHGAEDNFTPASHTRWLARQIPGAEIQVQENMAHFGAVEILPEMLAWLTV